MVGIAKEKTEKNGAVVIVSNGKKWVNETSIKDQLKHWHLATVTLQYSSELRKQRQELEDCGHYQPCRKLWPLSTL